MMERLTRELSNSAIDENTKTKVTILAKRDLLKILVKSTSDYIE